MKNFCGCKLKQIRESKGLHRVELAALMSRQYGCSKVKSSHIIAWEENGVTPGIDFAIALRDCLRVQLEDFKCEGDCDA